MKLIIGTRNKNKLKEIQQILAGLPLEVVSLEGFDNVPEVVEDGATLEENAIKKARAVSDASGLLTLADDSGLEVDYLKGAPGVYSARFAGENCTYDDNNRKLLKMLKGVPRDKRTARFRCVTAVAQPGGDVRTAEGRIEGYIAEEPKGSNGFGYDPVFVVDGYGITFAELDTPIKNTISHRAKAVNAAKDILLKTVKQD